MIDNQKIFDNYFDDAHITDSRLQNFAGDVLNSLTSAKTMGDYTPLVAMLTPLLDAFKLELGNVDTAFTVQKGATLTNDQVMTEIKTTISSEEPFIARAVGGRKTAIYLQFFPKGLEEYSYATKTSMPTLANRLYTAAAANTSFLGPELTSTLQAFKSSWQNSRDLQQKQMSSVGNNRAGRSDTRTPLELALIQVIGAIMQKFPGNIAQCSSFFNFNLLFPQTRNGSRVYASQVGSDQTVTVLNHNFAESNKITVQNTVDNAAIIVWLAASEKEPSPANALQINPGKKASIKPSALGDLKNPFLLIKNLSAVNAGGYQVMVK